MSATITLEHMRMKCLEMASSIVSCQKGVIHPDAIAADTIRIACQFERWIMAMQHDGPGKLPVEAQP